MNNIALTQEWDVKSGMKTIFHNPYVRKKLAGFLGVTQVRIGDVNYCMITERQSEHCKTQTLIPLQYGANTFTQLDILDLYAGKSLKLGDIFNTLTTFHYIVPAGYTAQVKRIGNDLQGSYCMHLTTVVPYYSKSTGEMQGYICQNIYIPKVMQVGGIIWSLNEYEAAALAHHGKFFKENDERGITMMNFKEIKTHATKSRQAVDVKFKAIHRGSRFECSVL